MVLVFAGAVEAAAMGNFVTGAALSAIASREFGRAYFEVRAAWDLYQSYDDANRDDRDISPAESIIEHGRD